MSDEEQMTPATAGRNPPRKPGERTYGPIDKPAPPQQPETQETTEE